MLSGPSDAIDLSPLRRALVVKLRHHGDVLLTSPLFSVLKARAPHMEIDALVYEDTRDMLSLHPAIAQVHGIGREWRGLNPARRLAAEWRLFSTLRRRQYQLLIHLSEHPRGAWLARALGCDYAVAPDYRNKPRLWKKSFTHRYALPLNARRHMVEIHLDALRRIGIQPAMEERRLIMVPGNAAEAEIASRLSACQLVDQPFVHFHPASRWQFKCWPAEQTAQLIDALGERGERVVLTAAPSSDEAGLVRAVLDRVKHPPVDFSGQLSLKALAALSARASVFVGVDSAPMHIASAMGTPVVALFGPSGEAEWGPWGVAHRVVGSTLHACRPCGIDGCGGGKISDCLVSLPMQRVLQAIDALSGGRS